MCFIINSTLYWSVRLYFIENSVWHFNRLEADVNSYYIDCQIYAFSYFVFFIQTFCYLMFKIWIIKKFWWKINVLYSIFMYIYTIYLTATMYLISIQLTYFSDDILFCIYMFILLMNELFYYYLSCILLLLFQLKL